MSAYVFELRTRAGIRRLRRCDQPGCRNRIRADSDRVRCAEHVQVCDVVAVTDQPAQRLDGLLAFACRRPMGLA